MAYVWARQIHKKEKLNFIKHYIYSSVNLGRYFTSNNKIIIRQQSIIFSDDHKDDTYTKKKLKVLKESAKILTMEAKTVKINKRTKSGQKSLKSDVSCDYFVPL